MAGCDKCQPKPHRSALSRKLSAEARKKALAKAQAKAHGCPSGGCQPKKTSAKHTAAKKVQGKTKGCRCGRSHR